MVRNGRNGDALRNLLSDTKFKIKLHAACVSHERLAKELAMPRVPRRYQWAQEACYHLMDRGQNREAIFSDDEDYGAFLALVARYRDRFAFRLYHYCLMTNHF